MREIVSAASASTATLAEQIDLDRLDAIAARLIEASDTVTAVAPIRDDFRAGDVASAYAIQERQTKVRLAQGRRLVGRKIGLTAKTVQRQLGVDQPDFGMLFDCMAVPDGETVPRGKLIAPRCEAEVAFALGRDLDVAFPTANEVLDAIAYVLPAIEIVDSRIVNWDIGIIDTVADNASSGLFVLGSRPVPLGEFDLRLCGMTLQRNGSGVSYGAGAACLGSPLNALTWLAAKMHELGRPLRAGDVVLSGALGPMIAASPGDVFEARISGLGSVRVAFAGESA